MTTLTGKIILDTRIPETEVGACSYIVVRENEKSVWAQKSGRVYRMNRSHVERQYRVVE